MIVRNILLGGPTDFGEEGLKPSELVETFNAAAFRSIAVNLTPTIVTVSRSGASGIGTTTDSDTMIVSVPAGVIRRFIHINANIYSNSRSFSASGGNVDSNTKYEIQKEFNAATIALVPLRTFVSTDAFDSGEVIQDSDRNEIYSNFYYEPTANEKLNGFDIKIFVQANATTNADTGSNTNATLTIDNIRIMGA